MNIRTPLAGVLLLGALACGTTHALPVIPGAAGFGVSTAAGRGGTVYRVTNLKETGSGSLGACVAATGARVCVFEISGTIRLSDDLVIRNPNITIAGQTAPSPGILLRGAGLRIQTSDVLVQHLRVRAGDDSAGPAPGNRDALKIEGSADNRVNNVVIDHCSFSWSIDEMASAWTYWDNVSFLNSIFAEPLDDSLHPQSGTPGDGVGHGYGVLFGSNDGSVSMIGNLLAHQVERNPLSRATGFVFVNNVVYNRANMDIELQSEGGRKTHNAIVGNVFIRGPSYVRDTLPVYVFAQGALALPNGSKVHVRDNVAQEGASDSWSLVGLYGSGMTRALLEATTAPVWPAGLSARSTANGAVLDLVLNNAGARPMDRDVVDERVIASVRNRNGRIVNCVAADGSQRCARNGGGWPQLATRTRTLALPSEPARITTAGYSNLEMWLNSMNASLEGRPLTRPLPPSDVGAR